MDAGASLVRMERDVAMGTKPDGKPHYCKFPTSWALGALTVGILLFVGFTSH